MTELKNCAIFGKFGHLTRVRLDPLNYVNFVTRPDPRVNPTRVQLWCLSRGDGYCIKMVKRIIMQKSYAIGLAQRFEFSEAKDLDEIRTG